MKHTGKVKKKRTNLHPSLRGLCQGTSVLALLSFAFHFTAGLDLLAEIRAPNV